MELMLALAITGILTLFSIPLYSHHVVHEKRLEAEIQLSALASALEQYYALHNSYKNATLNNLHIPEKIANNQYQLAISSQNESSFMLEAVPLDNQAKKDTSCGTLLLDSDGTKGIKGSGNILNCW